MRERIGTQKKKKKGECMKGKRVAVTGQGRLPKAVREMLEGKRSVQGSGASKPNAPKGSNAPNVPNVVSTSVANVPEDAAEQPKWMQDKLLREQMAAEKAKIDPVILLSRVRKLSHSRIIRAMAESQGYITVAAAKLKISYVTLRKIIDGSEKLQEMIECLNEARLDRAEHVVHKKVANEDLTAAMFVLRTQGKQRGYVEDQKSDMNRMLQPVTIIYASPKRVEQQDTAALPAPKDDETVIDIQAGAAVEVQQNSGG